MTGAVKVSFVPPTLRGLDRMQADALGVGVFSQDRPLRHVAGLADWRLNGQLSRVLLDGRFGAALGETMLLPCGHRLGARRLLLFGLGGGEAYDEARLAEAAEWLCGILSRLRAPVVAMPIPGAHRCRVPPGRAANLLVSAADRAYEGSGLSLRIELVVSAEDQRAVQSALESRRMDPLVEIV